MSNAGNGVARSSLEISQAQYMLLGWVGASPGALLAFWPSRVAGSASGGSPLGRVQRGLKLGVDLLRWSLEFLWFTRTECKGTQLH